MPQVTVYIREDDLSKWRTIKRKSEFMHHALNSVGDLAAYGQNKINEFAEKEGMPKLRVVERAFEPKAPDPETGYPCCAKNKPCKHWQWDGLKSAYVNELTGKEREVL